MIIPKGVIKELYDNLKISDCSFSARLHMIDMGELDKIDKTSPETFYESCEQLSYLYNKIDYYPGEYENTTPFCTIMKKEWVYKIGMYDEEFYPGGGEDCDFIYRLHNVTKCKWIDSKVIHQGHEKYNGESRNEEHYKENVRRKNNSIKKIENRWRKKILFLGNFNYFKTHEFLWDSLKQEFMRLGHECIFYDINKKTVNELQNIIEKFKPDIIFTGFTETFNLLKIINKQISNKNIFNIYFYYYCLPVKDFEFDQPDMMFLTNKSKVKHYKKHLNCKVIPTTFGVLDTEHHNLHKKLNLDDIARKMNGEIKEEYEKWKILKMN